MTDLEKLQYQINQLELTLSGGFNALEFKFLKILQENLDILWLLICAILVFLSGLPMFCFLLVQSLMRVLLATRFIPHKAPLEWSSV